MAKVQKSMQSKVIAALQAGRSLTIAQIQNYGFARPHNAIAVARARGLEVNTNTKLVKKVPTTVYSLATTTAA